MKWKKWVKLFVDKVLAWVLFGGAILFVAWASWDMRVKEDKWQEAGWSKCEGGWVPPGYVVEVVPEQLNPDGTAARPVQPFSRKPYDWNGGVGTPADYLDDGVDPPPDEVSKSLSKNP